MARGPSIHELQRVKEKNAELRRQQEKTSKELAVCKQQLDVTRSQLHAAEVARCTLQQYAESVEKRLGLNGKGQTTLKVAKLQSDAEWLERENSVLYADLQAKVHETEQLQQDLLRQRKLVEQASEGLPSSAVLDELYDLRNQVISLSDGMAEKEAIIRQQSADQQDMQVFKASCQALVAKTEDMQARAEAAESQNTELLDFIEEMQRAELELHQERDAAESRAEGLKHAQRAVEELQDALHKAHAERKAAHLEAAGKRVAEAEAHKDISELQIQLGAAHKQLAFVETELRGQLKTLQEALGSGALAAGLEGDTSWQMLDVAARDQQPRNPPAEVVTLCAKLSEGLRLVLAEHADLHLAAGRQQHLASQNTALWDKLQGLEPELQHARALIRDLQGQLSSSSANWNQLVEALISHVDPSGSHTAIPGREYEAATAVVSHVVRISHACARAKERVTQLESMTAALRKELAESQEDLAKARANCAQRPLQEEYEAALQQQHATSCQMLELKDRAAAAETQASLASRQLLELQQLLQQRDEDLKRQQQEAAQLEQTVHDLRVFRASVLMCGGSAASFPTPTLTPAKPHSHPWQLSDPPPAATNISLPSQLHSSYPNPPASLQSPTRTQPSSTVHGLHQPAPAHPLGPLQHNSWLAPATISNPLTTRSPTRSATTLAPATTRSPLITTRSPTRPDPAPPLPFSFPPPHAPYSPHRDHLSHMRHLSARPKRASSSDEDGGIVSSRRRRAATAAAARSPVPPHRSPGRPAPPPHKRTTSSDEDFGLVSGRRRRAAVAVPASGSLLQHRSPGRQGPITHKRASSSDEDSGLASSRRRRAAAAAAGSSSLLQHRSPGRPVPPKHKRASSTDEDSEFVSSRRRRAAAPPPSPAAASSSLLQHRPPPGRQGPPTQKRASSSDDEDGGLVSGRRRRAAATSPAPASSSLPQHRSPGRPAHSTRARISSSDDKDSGIVSSRHRRAATAAAAAAPAPAPASRSLLQHRPPGRPTRPTHARASSSDEDSEFVSSRRRRAAAAAPASNSLLQHRSPGRQGPPTHKHASSSDEDSGLVSSRRRRAAAAAAAAAPPATDTSNPGPPHRSPGRPAPPKHKRASSLDEDSKFVSSRRRTATASSSAPQHRLPGRPAHPTHTHASSSDDEDSGLVNSRRIGMPRRSPVKPAPPSPQPNRLMS